MELDHCLTTAQMAEKLGLTESALRKEASALGVEPVKFGGDVTGRGGVLIWTPENLGEMLKLREAKDKGICPACGARLPWADPAPEKVDLGAEEA